MASSGQWETEIALTTTAEVPVHGELRVHRADTSDPVESIPITIPAEGRVEITVGKFFQRPEDIACLSFLSNSGLLAGYTRFYDPRNRASLAQGSGSNHGWFTNIEEYGWSGIAFVNVDTLTASVTLTAYDDNGNQVAATTLTLTPGQKSLGLADQLFQSDIRNATYVKYSSDRKLLGFTVSGSADGQMLDGLHALGDYISAKKWPDSLQWRRIAMFRRCVLTPKAGQEIRVVEKPVQGIDRTFDADHAQIHQAGIDFAALPHRSRLTLIRNRSFNPRNKCYSRWKSST